MTYEEPFYLSGDSFENNFFIDSQIHILTTSWLKDSSLVIFFFNIGHLIDGVLHRLELEDTRLKWVVPLSFLSQGPTFIISYVGLCPVLNPLFSFCVYLLS